MTVTSAAQVAAKMGKAADALTKARPAAVAKASAELKQSVLAGAPARLRHVGKNGAALGVSTTAGGGAHPTSTGRATGPWALIEYDTPQHLIGLGRLAERSDRKGKYRRAKFTVSSSGAAMGRVLHGAGYAHPVRGPVVHPGTKGKLLFHKGVERGIPKAAGVMSKEISAAVFGAFR